MKHTTRAMIGSTLALIASVLIYTVYYVILPPINLGTYVFWFFVLISAAIVAFFSDTYCRITNNANNCNQHVATKLSVSIMILATLIMVGALVYGQPIWHANTMADFVTVKEASFEKDFPETDITNVPLMSRSTAEKLGDRNLGSIDKASQFSVSDEYTQLTIDGEPFRVSPLQYDGFFKWLGNRHDGIAQALKVNMYTSGVEVITFKKPIKYSNSEYFGRNIMRHLRFNYPSRIFGEPSFELDDDDNPYYIATVYKNQIGFENKYPTAVIIVDATDGSMREYELDEVPSWVDRVYPAERMQEYINFNGAYKFGWLNSVFAKRGVTALTDGYNYVSIGDDIYLYSGVTTHSAPNSNLGFVLMNMRTGEITKYSLPSATEKSAEKSAEGAVQEKGYNASFPILMKIDGRAAYMSALKDKAGLVKAYAIIDAVDYQTVVTASTIDATIELFRNSAKGKPLSVEPNAVLEGTISEIIPVVVDNNTMYYFKVDGKVLQVSIKMNNQLPFVKDGAKFKARIDEHGKISSFELVE